MSTRVVPFGCPGSQAQANGDSISRDQSPSNLETPRPQATYISSPLLEPPDFNAVVQVSQCELEDVRSFRATNQSWVFDDCQEPPAKRRRSPNRTPQQQDSNLKPLVDQKETIESIHVHSSGPEPETEVEVTSPSRCDGLFEFMVPQSTQPTCGSTGVLLNGPSKDEVCFGMIKEIPLELAKCSIRSSHSQNQLVFNDVYLDPSGQVFAQAGESLLGTLPDEWVQVLQYLCEGDLALQTRCKIRRADVLKTRSRQSGNTASYEGVLETILYGPEASFSDTGDLLEECRIFLQDPKGCNRNVPYRNPHSVFGMQKNPPMTIPDDVEALIVSKENNQSWQNCMDDLVFRQDLELASIPEALQTDLYNHQRQGLTFMRERERGWNVNGMDIWKATRSHNSIVYVNNLTGDEQIEPPVNFRGGILADGMGLGKTLTIISLVASELDIQSSQMPVRAIDNYVPTTLIIVPPPLIQTWKLQFAQHCKPGMLRVRVHHGRDRLLSDVECANYHVVLTSYHTVSAEYRRLVNFPSTLFSINWHRIILDEAHLIRDERSQMYKAICALQAGRRWAVTGTPIQNHVTDFVSLLGFLQVHPYDDASRFNKDIVQLWKIDHEAAIERFRKLITYITLRRTNKILNLPKRTDEIHHLSLNPIEEAFYENTEVKAHDAVNRSRESVQGKVHAWCTMNMLRSICNHGILAKTGALSEPDDTMVSPFTDHFGMKHLDRNVPSESDMYGLEEEIERGLSIDTTPTPIPTSFGPGDPAPTKVKALLKDLQSHPISKSVVFTFWSTTIDITINALTNAGISFVRYDGRVSSQARDLALQRFRADPSIQVILLTISCGAVGLDITVADRAYLMEPQWNPTVEDQALARIHRLGQTKPVTTVRFIVRDSIEQRIVALQKRKKRFVELLLTDKRSGKSSSRFEEFECLNSLLR